MSIDPRLIFLEYAMKRKEFPLVNITDTPVEGQRIVKVIADEIKDLVEHLGFTGNDDVPSNIRIISPDLKIIFPDFLADTAIDQSVKDSLLTDFGHILQSTDVVEIQSFYDENIVNLLFDNFDVDGEVVYVLSQSISTSTVYTETLIVEN